MVLALEKARTDLENHSHTLPFSLHHCDACRQACNGIENRMRATPPFLSVTDLSCTRGHATLFTGLNFTLHPGDMLVVTGKNGSGKTSLLRLLADLLDTESGTVARPESLRWLGVENALKRDLSVGANLAFWGIADNGPRAAIKIRHLSRGQTRSVALARLTPAPLWLLDEPESGLDAANRQMLVERVAAHRMRGGITVIGTHHPDLWDADQMLHLGGGAPGIIIRRTHNEAPAPQNVESDAPAVFMPTLVRDLRLNGRNLSALLFFVLASVLFPLGLSPDPALLRAVACGVIAMAVLFAALLATDRLFDADFEDGTLDALMAERRPLPLYCLARIVAAWTVALLPVAIASPAMALMFGIPVAQAMMLPLMLLPATLLLVLFGALGAALSLTARAATLLLALITLPLYIPVLIFTASAMEMARMGGSPATPLLLLFALLAAALPVVPVLSALILRMRVRS